MTDPILTGEQVRSIREALGMTQEQLATKLGYHGALRRQSISKIETGADKIDYLRGNLLLAMAAGYVPVGFDDDAGITLRQAEALWAAQHEGRADALLTTEKRAGGGFWRMLGGLKSAGMLNQTLGITKAGSKALATYLLTHKINPRTKGNPTGRWA